MDIRAFFNELGLRVDNANEGTGEYTIFCPLHDEEKASLKVNPIKGVYHCFGACGIGGGGMNNFFRAVFPSSGYEEIYFRFVNMFPFITKMRYALEEEKTKPAWIEIDVDVLDEAQEDISYFEERRIRQETIQSFGIKYHKLFDSLVIPIYDDSNPSNYRGYVRRNLSSEPPYVNGINVKDLLFPLDKLTIKDGTLILVEGIFDAVKAHQEGLTNCLATIGGRITKDQVRRIGNYVSNVILCPDRDRQGVQIAEKNTELLKSYGFNLSYARVPGGAKDLAQATNLDTIHVESYFWLTYHKKSIKNFILD